MLRPAATRGTPRPAREAAMDIVALSGAESRANCRAGPTERPVREVAISVEAGLPKTARPATTEVATRLGAESLKRSMPKSTPPYRPCIFGAESVLRAPSFKLIFEKQRSFHSWGTSRQHTPPLEPSMPTLNQGAPRTVPDSIKYFARMEAFATSRSWETTLLRSAMRSKLWVNTSAYITSGWSGRVMAASSRPSSPTTCSRASTPILR
mmetsp:Transcript_27363/g.77023  ORF Transcript_27363/g.77023 Transcript_27363/m.77023 type:complete len:209 (-) Transcript_27363:1068-1694(-)